MITKQQKKFIEKELFDTAHLKAYSEKIGPANEEYEQFFIPYLHKHAALKEYLTVIRDINGGFLTHEESIVIQELVNIIKTKTLDWMNSNGVAAIGFILQAAIVDAKSYLNDITDLDSPEPIDDLTELPAAILAAMLSDEV